MIIKNAQFFSVVSFRVFCLLFNCTHFSACIRAVGGQSRKMAKPIFGRGLAVWCERSEHGKSQLSINKLSYFSELSSYAKFLTLFFFKVALLLGCPRIAANVVAAWRQAGG